MLAALTLLVRLVASKLSLTLRQALHLIALALLIAVTVLVTEVGESSRSVLNRWLHTDMHLTKG